VLDPALQQTVVAVAADVEAQQREIMKTRVAANDAMRRAAGVTSPPSSRRSTAGCCAAGQVAVDDWVQKMGADAAPILDGYRKRLAKP
jgi:hypothetical protein